MDAKDFRPISLLAIFSKIIKRVIHNQNMDYLTENNISVDIHLVFARTIKQILP